MRCDKMREQSVPRGMGPPIARKTARVARRCDVVKHYGMSAGDLVNHFGFVSIITNNGAKPVFQGEWDVGSICGVVAVPAAGCPVFLLDSLFTRDIDRCAASSANRPVRM